MQISKSFMNNANEVYKRYLSGSYLSKSDLAKSLGISRNDINPLIKIYEWPIEIKNKIQNMNLSKRKIIDLTSQSIEEVKEFVQSANNSMQSNLNISTKQSALMQVNAGECNQMQTASVIQSRCVQSNAERKKTLGEVTMSDEFTPIPTRLMQKELGKKKVHTRVNAPETTAHSASMQAYASECNQVQTENIVYSKRLQEPLLDQETLERLKLGLKVVATITLVLMLIGLAAWLTCDLYLGFSATLRPYAAYAVLTVVGVILPVVAHLAHGWGKPIAWSLVVLGVFYSSSLVLIGNWQKGTIEQAKSAGKQAKIEALESELVIVKEQHSQWMSGYTDPQNKNYHKAYAAKKAKDLTAHIASIQDQVTALKVSAGSFSWLMVIVDVLRQVVIELALILVVHTGISKLLFSQNDRWVKDNGMKMNENTI